MMHFSRMTVQCLLGLKAIACNAYNSSLTPAYPALLDKLFCRCYSNAAGRLSKNALCPCKQFYPLNNLFVRNILTVAARFLDYMTCIISIGRITNSKRLSHSIGLDRLNNISTLFDGCRDGRAACGLRSKYFCPKFFDKPDFLKFPERLPDLCQKRTAGAWHNHVIRRFPSKLFKNLEPMCFGTFCIEWPDVYIYKCPPVFICNLAAKPVDFIVIAVDGEKIRFIYQ